MSSSAARIIGNYELGEAIGRGGASEVFAAVHRFLGHEVAVKLLRAEPAGDDAGAIDAFLGEAARARAVRHPGLVSVLDFGRDDASGRCYLVMERIPGESVAERLRRVGRFDEAGVRALGGALAAGMQAAHDGGIVHRDLKPANVMLRGDQPTVVDFGLARDLGGRSALETGRRVGTPAYMAPEQLTGGLIAPCVDIWALGVILFEALTGRLPFEGFADGRCPQLFEVAPRVSSLVDVSRELDALVAACLEREPGRRPASMAAVERALRGEADERITQDIGEHSIAASGPPREPEVAPPRRSRARLPAVAAVAVAAAALVARAMRGDAGDGQGASAGAGDRRPAGEAVPAGPAPGSAPSSAPSSVPSSAPTAPATSSSAPAARPPAGLDLEVRSVPSGADVLVAGERRGRTPTRVRLAGPGAILLRKRGYLPARVRVGQSGLVDVRLSRRAAPEPRDQRGARRRPRAAEQAEGLD